MPRFVRNILIAASCLAAPALAAAQSAENMRLQIVHINDPTGFERPMPAASSLLPSGWTTQGGVIWNVRGDCTFGQTVDWMATSADEKAGIRLLPNEGWRYNNQGQAVPQDCYAKVYNSAEDYGADFVKQFPEGRVTEVERDTQTARMLSQSPFTWEMQGDPYTKYWWDAANIYFEFIQDGVEYSGLLTLFTSHTYMLSGHSYGFGQPLEMNMGMAGNRMVMAAPKDEIDAYLPAFMLFLKNYRVNPEWQARMNRHNQTMNRQAIESSRKISSTISKTYSDISDMSMESWKRRNAMTDVGQRETSEMIRGVETYNADTPTGQVELPLGYDRAFQLDDGTFVVTNDRFFDPMNGRELNAIQ